MMTAMTANAMEMNNQLVDRDAEHKAGHYTYNGCACRNTDDLRYR
jgi:hypothetical protein